MKTGTTITFMPSNLTGFTFDMWELTGNQCGVGVCELTLGDYTDPVIFLKAVR